MDEITEIRSQLRRRRSQLPGPARARAGFEVLRRLESSQLLRNVSAIAAYVASDGEIETQPLIRCAWAMGVAVLLPRAVGRELEFARVMRGERLREGRWGIPMPAGPSVPIPPGALALLPVVAWSGDGTRLGRGGGFYDRAAARWPSSVLRVGLAYELQYVDELPRRSWDVPLDIAVSESRLMAWMGGDSCWEREGAIRHGIRVDVAAGNCAGSGFGMGDRCRPQPTA